MKLIFPLLFATMLCSPAYAGKDYAQRFPTGTSLEVYTPNNPPPGIGEAPIDGAQYVRSDGAWEEATIPAGTPSRTVSFTFDGNYASPSAASIASCVMGYDGAFTGWKIINVAGTSSSIVLTIKKNGTAISGSEKPTLSSASTNTDTNLTTWTTSFVKGDVITAYVDSASTGISYTCSLYATASN